MPKRPDKPKAGEEAPRAAADATASGSGSPSHLVEVSKLDPAAASDVVAPTDEQIFYLRVLARYLCSRKGFKTLTLADFAELKGSQKQKENKAQAFLNRYTKGHEAFPDYRVFRKGVLKLRNEYAGKGTELFDDPIMQQAFAAVYPYHREAEPDDDFFVDEPLGKWFAINPLRSRSVCESYSGLWWIVRPSTTRSRPERETEPEFNVSLLNIVPEDASKTKLPLFTFRQPVGGTNVGVSSHGRVLALDSDHQVLLLGKRRGSQTPTQLSWKYVWDLDHPRHESVIDGTIFTVNTNRVQIQSYFYGCYIEGTAPPLRGSEFEEVNKLLRRFLGIKTEAELEDVPTSLEEVQLLMLRQTSADDPPLGRSALQQGHLPSHRPIVSSRGLERLKAIPQDGPILTIS